MMVCSRAVAVSMVSDVIQSLLADVTSLRGSAHITATVNATTHGFVSETLLPIVSGDILADEEPIPSVRVFIDCMRLWCIILFLSQTLHTLMGKLIEYDAAFAAEFRGVPLRQSIAESP